MKPPLFRHECECRKRKANSRKMNGKRRSWIWRLGAAGLSSHFCSTASSFIGAFCSPHRRRLVVSKASKMDPPVWPVAGRKLRHPLLKSSPFFSSCPPATPIEKSFKSAGWEGFPLVRQHVFNLSLLSFHFSDQKTPFRKSQRGLGRTGIPLLYRPAFLYSSAAIAIPRSALSSHPSCCDWWWQTVCSSLQITCLKCTHSSPYPGPKHAMGICMTERLVSKENQTKAEPGLPEL